MKGFFAFPSEPISSSDAITDAVREINDSGYCFIKTWKECRIGGKIIIDEICQEIDSSSLFLADLTGLNPNVMFELGYAIAKGKRIWIILDTSITDAKRSFDEVKILTTTGYKNYQNAGDISQGLYEEQPWNDIDTTVISKKSIESSSESTLLFLKSRHTTQADTKLSNLLNDCRFPLTVDDPSESSLQALPWYVEKTHAAIGVVVHLCPKIRTGWEFQNARYSFVAGLSFGFERPLLILAESGNDNPIDYRDILKSYSSALECESIAEQWLSKIETDYQEQERRRRDYLQSKSLAHKLADLRIGEYIAEREQDQLNDYFVKTSAFNESLEGRHTLFIGSKGSGKTANLLALKNEFAAHGSNVVCEIRPVAYELDSLVGLLRNYRERDKKGYLIEAIWKLLLYTEIARSTEERIIKPHSQPAEGSPEASLRDILSHNNGDLRKEFGIRLEQVVTKLVNSDLGDGVKDFRTAISEKLHTSLLGDLRNILGQMLCGMDAVVVLIDNLDKTWTQRDDLDLQLLSEFLLGLIRASADIKQDFERNIGTKKRIPLTLAIFLRSDIFSHLIKIAREPDKIVFCRLVWDDPQVLLRVIDRRLVSWRGQDISPDEIWRELFCERIKGKPVKEYLLEHSLNRPRDIIYFVKRSIAVAVNRNHIRVEEEDVLTAEKEYSQFAMEIIKVENEVACPEIEDVLYQFVGGNSILTRQEVYEVLQKAEIAENRYEEAIRNLSSLSFLGAEIGDNVFTFDSGDGDSKKNEILARRLSDSRGSDSRFKINIPFRAFLEVE